MQYCASRSSPSLAVVGSTRSFQDMVRLSKRITLGDELRAREFSSRQSEPLEGYCTLPYPDHKQLVEFIQSCIRSRTISDPRRFLGEDNVRHSKNWPDLIRLVLQGEKEIWRRLQLSASFSNPKYPSWPLLEQSNLSYAHSLCLQGLIV